jgi:hypothetical protein
MPTSPPASVELDAAGENAGWPALPTETEIYILPDGRIVIADLPAELAAVLAELGVGEPCVPTVSESTSSER